MSEEIRKIGDSYWRIGKGMFGFSVEEYIENTDGSDVDTLYVQKTSTRALIFKTLKEARQFLDAKEKA